MIPFNFVSEQNTIGKEVEIFGQVPVSFVAQNIVGQEGKIFGREVLSRFPKIENKKPEEVINFFKKHGAIVKYDLYVLEKVLTIIVNDYSGEPLFVNLSGETARHTEKVYEMIVDFGPEMIADKLVIELSEDSEIEVINEFSDLIRPTGVKIALDDVDQRGKGKGLPALEQIPDIIKISRDGSNWRSMERFKNSVIVFELASETSAKQIWKRIPSALIQSYWFGGKPMYLDRGLFSTNRWLVEALRE